MSDGSYSSTLGCVCVNKASSQVSLNFSPWRLCSREVKSNLVTLGQMLILSGHFGPDSSPMIGCVMIGRLTEMLHGKYKVWSVVGSKVMAPSMTAFLKCSALVAT